MIRFSLCGFAGRMGQEIALAVKDETDLEIVLGVERPGHPSLGVEAFGVRVVEDLRGNWLPCDLVVDFTLGEKTTEFARIAAENGAAFISGATGLNKDDFEELRRLAGSIPLLHANNMSKSITVATDLVERAARRLVGYDVEITELHHRHKKDAPSGTAVRFLEVLRDVRGELRAVHGRCGDTGGRGDEELGIHSLRGGEAVGEHHVMFAGPGERLIITHVADSRRAFVMGVLAAIRFLAGKEPRLYTMNDLL